MEDRTRALIFLHEKHLKSNTQKDREEVKRAYEALYEIAYPAPAETGQINKEPSCPSDATRKEVRRHLGNVDPKTYY